MLGLLGGLSQRSLVARNRKGVSDAGCHLREPRQQNGFSELLYLFFVHSFHAVICGEESVRNLVVRIFHSIIRSIAMEPS